MKNQNIVLIIGAGASHDFEPAMGLGIHLVNEICKRVYEDDQTEQYLSDVLKGLGYKSPIRQQFQKDLSAYINKSQNPSIDNFINCYKENNTYKKIAKFMIAAHVLGYEQKCTQNASFNKESWLKKLGNILQINGDLNNDKSNFNIITFNYDRLIEESLYRQFGQSVETFVNSHIHHFYNQLSYLPWQHKLLGQIAAQNKVAIQNGNLNEIKPLPFLDFGHPNYDSFRIKERENEILLIYDTDRENQDQIIKSREIIENADAVCFMGFAYDQLNMEKLGLTKMETIKKGKIDWTINFYVSYQDASNIKIALQKAQRKNELYFNNKATIASNCCSDFVENILKDKLIKKSEKG